MVIESKVDSTITHPWYLLLCPHDDHVLGPHSGLGGMPSHSLLMMIRTFGTRNRCLERCGKTSVGYFRRYLEIMSTRDES